VSAFIEGHRERFGVEPICHTLGVSVSAYYERASGRRSSRTIEDERLLARVKEVHEANYCAYGLSADLEGSAQSWRERRPRSCAAPDAPERHPGRQAARQALAHTTRPDPEATRPGDLVQRDFAASHPDEKWFADFTYLRCWEGLVFFSFVIDAYSRRIVGWQFAAHTRTTLVLDALRMALHQRQPGADVALIQHTDAGSQYTSYDYTQTLSDHGVLASIGTVGDALDNAVAESFVDSFKTELIADRTWATRSQLELAVVEYVA
jgi:transposase InsO family protein